MWCKVSVHLMQIFGILILNGGSYGADCPAGEEFDDTTQSCIKCRVGFYRGEDVGGLCQKCPGPFITSTSGATSERECDLAIGNKDTCPSGTEWVSMQERCITCSRGTYRVKGHDYWCVDCPGGTHTHSEGATSVLQCLDPCPLGAEWDQVLFECSPCPVDRFRSHGMTGCQSCPSGHTTVRTGSVAVNDCIPLPNSTHQIFTSDDCPSGTQWGGLLAVCEMCQINCEICPVDSYRRAGLHAQCEFCPAGTGTVLPGAGSAELCIDDSVAEAARERPPPSVNCPVGTEWNPYEVACQPCRVGFYKDHPARRICSECDADQNTPVTGSTNASFCGQTSLSADQKPFTSGDCPLGTEWSSSPPGCKLCPVGYFRSDPSLATCASCPDAKLTKAPGASSDEDCVIPTTEANGKAVEYHRPENCPSGSEWNSLLDGCEPCGKGYHRNKSEGLLQCQQCPEGFSSFYPGSKDVSMCIVPLVGPERIPIDFISGCEPGYQPNNPRRECTACPRGTYKQDTNFDNCGYCPFNSAGETSGTRYKGTAEVSGCLQEVRVSELRPSSGALGGGYALSVYFSSRDFSERLLSVMVGGEECQLHFFKITDGHVNCTMPPSHVTGSRTISARLGDGRTLTTLEPFTYRLDPVIDSVSRGKMFAGGGANITIRGADFPSSGNRLTITNFDGSGQPRAVDSDCVVVDLTIMRCLVPSMTHWFSNNTRRKRSTRPAPLIAHLGVDLLGSDYYKNITAVMPEYGAVYIFAGPEMESLSQTQYVVTPDLDTVISFQGIGLNEGAIKEDYQISIGSHTCVVANLSESIVTCLIPSHQAIKLAPDRSYPTTVQVGPYSFHPGDVTFTGPALTPAGAISPTPVLPSGPGTPVNDTGAPGAISPVGQPGGNNSSGASPTGPSVSASAGSGGPADSSRTTASMIQQPGITGPGTGQPGTNPGSSMTGPPGLTASTGGGSSPAGEDGSPDGVTAPVGPPGASPGSDSGPSGTGPPGSDSGPSGTGPPGSGSGPSGAGPSSDSGPPGAGPPGSDSGPPGAGPPGSGSGPPGAGPGSGSGPPGAGPGSGSGPPGAGPGSPGSASSAGGSSGDGGQAGGNSTTLPGHAPPPAGNHTVGGGGDGGKGPDSEPGNSGGQPGNTVTNNTGTPAKINTDTDNAVSPPSNNPETDVVDDKSGPDLVSILVPVLVVLCVVVTLIVTVALLYCQRRKRRKQYADGTLVRSTVSSISDPGLDAPSDGFLPPLPVDSVFGRDRVTDKGVKQRPLSLPEDGTMPTIGRTHKGLGKTYSTHSTAKLDIRI